MISVGGRFLKLMGGCSWRRRRRFSCTPLKPGTCCTFCLMATTACLAVGPRVAPGSRRATAWTLPLGSKPSLPMTIVPAGNTSWTLSRPVSRARPSTRSEAASTRRIRVGSSDQRASTSSRQRSAVCSSITACCPATAKPTTHCSAASCGVHVPIITNGIALSGTVHWMFDRGLIGLSDDLEILISRQANDPDGIRGMINRNGFAIPPTRALERPHPGFLAWHRENCFKH